MNRSKFELRLLTIMSLSNQLNKDLFIHEMRKFDSDHVEITYSMPGEPKASAHLLLDETSNAELIASRIRQISPEPAAMIRTVNELRKTVIASAKHGARPLSITLGIEQDKACIVMAPLNDLSQINMGEIDVEDTSAEVLKTFHVGYEFMKPNSLTSVSRALFRQINPEDSEEVRTAIKRTDFTIATGSSVIQWFNPIYWKSFMSNEKIRNAAKE